MSFWGFGRTKTIEETATFLARNVEKSTIEIFKRIFIPIIKYDLSSKDTRLLMESEKQFTEENQSYVIFDLGTFVYFRLDHALTLLKASIEIRQAFINECTKSIFEFVDEPSDFLTSQFDFRMDRFTKSIQVYKGVAYGKFVQYVNDFAFSLIRRAANASNLSDWEMDEKTIIFPSIFDSMLGPEAVKMENKFIAPLIKTAKRNCKGL